MKKILGLFIFFIILVGCSGAADKPFVLNPNVPPPTPVLDIPGGGGDDGGGGDGGDGEQGCVAEYTAGLLISVQMNGKLAAKQPPPFPFSGPLKLIFNGNQVALDMAHFPEVSMPAAGFGKDDATGEPKVPADLFIRAVKGQDKAVGTYDPATGQIEIPGVELELEAVGIETKALPPVTLTTGDVSADGKFGDLQESGLPLTPELDLDLVIGLTFPEGGAIATKLGGAAVTAKMTGKLNRSPDDPTCTADDGGGGTFGGGGKVKIYELVKKTVTTPESQPSTESQPTSESQPSPESQPTEQIEEIELLTGTVNFGSVFIPDSGAVDDPRYKKTKQIKIVNETNQTVSFQLKNDQDFHFKEESMVTIPSGESTTLEISFYTSIAPDQTVLKVEKRTLEYQLNTETKLTLTGKVKPKGPELFVEGVEINESDTVDFGSSLIKVAKVGGQNVLSCKEKGNRSTLTKMVYIKNHGVKELHIKNISPAVDTDQDAEVGPFCPQNASEFNRTGIMQYGSAKCETFLIAGKDFLYADCKIPHDDPNSYIGFKVVYLPKNANNDISPDENIPDTGAITILSDDPIYDPAQNQEPFHLKLRATTKISGEAPVRLTIKKINDQGVVKPEIEPNIGTSLKVNVPEPAQGAPLESAQLDVAILNYSSDAYQIKSVQLLDDKSVFKLTDPELPMPLVPVNGGGSPGETPLKMSFSPPQQSAPGSSFTAKLIIEAVNDRSEGEVTKFEFGFEGVVGELGPKGRYNFRIDFLTAFISKDLLKPIKSLNFKLFPDQRPNPPVMEFSEYKDKDDNVISNLREVRLITQDISVEILEKMSIDEREGVLRILNAQMTKDKLGNTLIPGDDNSKCKDPDKINKAYTNGECAYFYFGLQAPEPGVYDIETGHLVLPNIEVKVINPYHMDVAPFVSTVDLDVTLDISLSTFKIDNKQASIVPLGNQTLVPDNRLNLTDLIIPKTDNFKEAAGCPEEGVDAEKPEFKCFISPLVSGLLGTLDPGAQYYITGTPLQAVANTKDYNVIVAAVGKFPPYEEVVAEIGFYPFFILDGKSTVEPARLYFAIKGVLQPESATPAGQ